MVSLLTAGATFENTVVLDVQPADREGYREVFHEVDLNTMEALSEYGEQILRKIYTKCHKWAAEVQKWSSCWMVSSRLVVAYQEA